MPIQNKLFYLGLTSVFTILIVACASKPPKQTDFSYENIYMRNVLGNVLNPNKISSYLNVPVAIEEDHLVINNRTLTVLPYGENFATRDGIKFFSARFEVTIDDKFHPQLTSGAVGQNHNLYNEKDEVVVNWYYSFGKALLRAIADKHPDVKYKDYNVYAGQAQFRGKTPRPLKGREDAKLILQEIDPLLPQKDGKLHAVIILLGIKNGRIQYGECRIDGQLSADLCAMLKNLSWPKSSTIYQRKQAYVFK